MGCCSTVHSSKLISYCLRYCTPICIPIYLKPINKALFVICLSLLVYLCETDPALLFSLYSNIFYTAWKEDSDHFWWWCFSSFWWIVNLCWICFDNREILGYLFWLCSSCLQIIQWITFHWIHGDYEPLARNIQENNLKTALGANIYKINVAHFKAKCGIVKTTL